MNYPKIGLDMDGVLSIYTKAYTNRLIQTTGSNLFEFKKDDAVWDDWNMDLKVGYSKEQRMVAKDSIENDSYFWLQLEPYVGTKEALHRLIFETDNLYFITDRSGNSAKVQSELWLAKLGVPNPTVLISAKKGDIVGALGLDYYVDDNINNCWDAVEHGANHVFLFNRPWNINLDIPSPKINRIDTLMEFVSYVQSQNR